MEIVGLEDIPKRQGEEQLDGEEQEEVERLPKNSLMSLLSGPQTKKKPHTTSRARIRKDDKKGEDMGDIKTINDNERIADLESKVYRQGTPTSSKDIFKAFQKPPQQLPSSPPPEPTREEDVDVISEESDTANTTIDIESKIYSGKKSTSVRDLFTNFKPKRLVTLKLPPATLQKYSSSDILEEDSEVNDAATIESRIYANAKSVSVQDMFKQVKPGQPSKFVRLKVSPEVLLQCSSDISEDGEVEEVHTSDIERRIYESKPKSSVLSILNLKQPESKAKRGSARNTPKARDTLFVTLRVNSEHLARIKQYDNPLVTRGSNGNGKSSKSFFASMMQASRTASKLEHIQHEKEINPPDPLKRCEFHVYDKSDDDTPRRISLGARERRFGGVDGVFQMFPDMLAAKPQKKYRYEAQSFTDLREYALSKLPNLHKAPALEFAFSKIGQSSGTELWVDFFKPQQVNDLLVHKEVKSQIYNWISNSFPKLESQAPLKDMKQKIKQRKLQEDSFVVYDDETDEEIFSPFLIIQGSSGSGKSTAVHTVMNQLHGYVHEINTSQNRGRKDIYNNLKELCTTQSVKDTSEFHNGLVLLDDVNVLFEQDKTFWGTVQEIVNLSKRPIVMTCEELWNIPKSMIEFARHDESVVFMDDFAVSRKLVVDYLWLCCLVHFCDLDESVLDEIVDENWNGNAFDIRRCLMTCQALCEPRRGGITKITKSEQAAAKEVCDLAEAASILDVGSSANVISSLSKTQLKQTIQPNELDDIYWVDDHSPSSPLPYELNIGDALQTQVDNFDRDNSTPLPKFHINDLRHETKTFLGSRAKYYLHIAIKKTRTGGGSMSMLDTVGVADSSCLNHANNTAFLLDVLPVAREWSRYLKAIDQFERDNVAQGKPSIKHMSLH
ncbi:Telomere length regulation protein ELG1 [Candida viswanathii]|uniref:Telomere length regulation protein ELG1 n=1 Tax=Candida viswanathii TaxID=5486 RepID=A0A367YJ63_9ASCO|nr:Telomere length regulation protein ELG1 [Candida viswanathii]